ncbi:MAG: ribonucleotide reductase subunit alpha [Pseudomonadota bacterium]|jgi:hypothetical protein
MQITSFKDLVNIGLAENKQQRLLLVFVKADAREGTPGDGGERGALTPVMCTDKVLSKVLKFDKLVAEADSVSRGWDFVLISSLGSRGTSLPSAEEADVYLQRMANMVQMGGDLSGFVIFDRQETPIIIQSPLH